MTQRALDDLQRTNEMSMYGYTTYDDVYKLKDDAVGLHRTEIMLRKELVEYDN